MAWFTNDWFSSHHTRRCAHKSGDVINFIIVARRISSRLQWYKNYKNRLRLAKVIVKNKMSRFLWFSVYIRLLQIRNWVKSTDCLQSTVNGTGGLSPRASTPLSQYQIILLCNRTAYVWTTCPETLHPPSLLHHYFVLLMRVLMKSHSYTWNLLSDEFRINVLEIHFSFLQPHRNTDNSWVLLLLLL